VSRSERESRNSLVLVGQASWHSAFAASLAGAIRECSALLFPRLSCVCDCRVHVGLLTAITAMINGEVVDVVVVGVMCGGSGRWWQSEVCDSTAEGWYRWVRVKSSDRIGVRRAAVETGRGQIQESSSLAHSYARMAIVVRAADDTLV